MSITISDALELLKLDFEELKKLKSEENIWDSVKQAYKKAALKYHPDKYNGPDAAEHFQKISNAYTLLGNYHATNSLAHIFTGLFAPKIKPNIAETKTEKNSYLDLRDAMKNSLYAYYLGRYGVLEESLDEYGYNTIRSMLSTILGISPLSFDLNYKPGSGYVIRAKRPEIIEVINQFLKTIQDYDTDNLKTVSNEYEIDLATAQALLGKERGIMHPDSVTFNLKILMKLPNTSTIFTYYNKDKETYSVWVKPLEGFTIPEVLGNPKKSVPKMVIDSKSKSVAPIPIKIESTFDDTNIQLGFVLDATGSMSSAINSAKNALREAGEQIEGSTNKIPQMTVCSYHDYGDMGRDATSAAKDWNWREYVEKRIDDGEGYLKQTAEEFIAEAEALAHMGRERHMVFDEPLPGPQIIESNKNAVVKKESIPGKKAYELIKQIVQEKAGEKSQSTPKLAVLNYPGRRDAKPWPKFTTPDKISNILDAVNADGGGDAPEMLEAALTTMVELEWNKPVRTLYVALDAPPHNHYEGASGDHYPTPEKIKSAQEALLTSDPILKTALNPEDWITQTLILARKGVKINMMVCGHDEKVLFMATFMSVLTGGSVILMDDYHNMGDIIEKNTALDCIDVGIATTAIVKAEDVKTNKSNLNPKYYDAVIALLKEINLDEVFSTKAPLTDPSEQARISALAAHVRKVYSKAIKTYSSSPALTVAESEKITKSIASKVLENRKKTNIAIEAPKTKDESLLIQEINRLVADNDNNAIYKFDLHEWPLHTQHGEITNIRYGRSKFGEKLLGLADDNYQITFENDGTLSVFDKVNRKDGKYSLVIGKARDEIITNFCTRLDLKQTFKEEGVLIKSAQNRNSLFEEKRRSAATTNTNVQTIPPIQRLEASIGEICGFALNPNIILDLDGLKISCQNQVDMDVWYDFCVFVEDFSKRSGASLVKSTENQIIIKDPQVIYHLIQHFNQVPEMVYYHAVMQMNISNAGAELQDDGVVFYFNSIAKARFIYEAIPIQCKHFIGMNAEGHIKVLESNGVVGTYPAKGAGNITGISFPEPHRDQCCNVLGLRPAKGYVFWGNETRSNAVYITPQYFVDNAPAPTGEEANNNCVVM